MVPLSLIKLGLNEALLEYCLVHSSDAMKINFQFIGDFLRLNDKYEMSLFFSARELIKNAIQHSNGTTLLVQVIQVPDRLCIVVEDNGIGFDSNMLNNPSELGFKSVKLYAESIGAQINIDSQSDKGSEIIIELPL